LTPFAALLVVVGAALLVAGAAPEADPDEDVDEVDEDEEPQAAVSSANPSANANRDGIRRMKPPCSRCLIGAHGRGPLVTLGFSQVNARSKRKCGATVGA
jgi:hypothetical protein